ncbi:hypothetical protein [Actinacidiphila soli]|uniref:hypothetical protein n=1 Tax=Actinacidiphila soli TaxID=2487275 RepID=UPI001F0C012D|nr:hypothetical protein [Actinacidiphila soli]
MTAPYIGACGEDFRVVASTPIRSSQTSALRTTYVTYSTGADQICAVTIRNDPGPRTFMEVTLDTWPTGGNPARDYESFTTYAGPMYKDAPKAA